MTRNNYDMNSEGINIEAVVQYDQSAARYMWEENFNRHKNSDDHYTYLENGNLVDDMDYSISGTVKQLRHLIRDGIEEGSINDCPYYKYTKGELIEEIQAQIIDHYDWFYDAEEIQEWFKNYGVKYELSHTPINVRGYSQGDYACVWVDLKLLERQWGKKPDTNELQQMFERLFYDQPIYARVEINGDTIEHGELCEDQYKWDKAEFIEKVVNVAMINAYVKQTERQKLKAYLEDMLPDQPDYT